MLPTTNIKALKEVLNFYYRSSSFALSFFYKKPFFEKD